MLSLVRIGIAVALGFVTAACAARVTAPTQVPLPAPVAVDAPTPEISSAPAQPGPVPVLVDASTPQVETRDREPEAAPLESVGDVVEAQREEAAGIGEVLAMATGEVPPPTEGITQAVTTDLQTIIHDIDIPLNAKVLSFVQLLTGRLKPFLEEGLNRGMAYLPMVQGIFAAEGLPLDLAYVPLVESAFKPTALSRARARGMWQFMSGTALENGLTHDWFIDERAEPEKATRAAAKYLKTLHDTFNGDWHLALASYNGGPNRVQRAINRSGRADFWMLTASTRYLPRETRNYVPLVLAAIIIARNPAAYGFDIQPFEPLRFETVTLPAAVDLRRIGDWLGTSAQTIQTLNPELRRWTTPVRATEYALKVPPGTGDIIRAHLAQADPGELAPLNWHTVKKGETLQSVARTLKVTRADLAEANYLSTRARLHVGQRLMIPRAPALLLATGLDDPGLVAQSPPAPDGPSTSVLYRVKRGDTLFAIARLHRTTVAALKTWNRLRTNSITIGQRLTIFPERATATD